MSIFTALKNYLHRARAEADNAHRSGVLPDESAAAAKGSAAYPSAWTGVDLDGTLAVYDESSSLSEIGPPVPLMLERVKAMIDRGERVKIVTARAAEPEQLPMIQKWLKENGLPPLEITNAKDYNMIRLYDDRCIQVETNTGRVVTCAPGKGEDGK
jgi:hypothetical protein